MGSIVTNHTQARVTERSEECRGIVSRGLVDDDHLESDVALAQHAAQRQGKQSATIACRHDDRYIWAIDQCSRLPAWDHEASEAYIRRLERYTDLCANYDCFNA